MALRPLVSSLLRRLQTAGFSANIGWPVPAQTTIAVNAVTYQSNPVTYHGVAVTHQRS